jgi:CheY-like chemotaxis protein
VDVVVSDLELADGDGCALLKQLQLHERRQLPAIAITGYSQQEWRNRASNCGFTRYAVKPFSLERITDWIVELTRESSASGESVEF